MYQKHINPMQFVAAQAKRSRTVSWPKSVTAVRSSAASLPAASERVETDRHIPRRHVHGLVSARQYVPLSARSAAR